MLINFVFRTFRQKYEIYEIKSRTVHPVRYEAITADLVKSISLRSRGAAGPSGVDAGTWKKMCSSFKDASVHLCRATARLARHLAESCVNPKKFEPLLASRLIALDKQPGVRPIGVGEILRRVISKAILQVAKPDIEEACGFVQKCSGMPAGIEAAVHAMQEIYMDESTEGILLVDATNAFNSMNRSAALHREVHLPGPSHLPAQCVPAPFTTHH